MSSVLDMVRQRLLEKGMQYLVVFEGNCTGTPMIWVHGPQYRSLATDELDFLDELLGDPKPHTGHVYSYGVWEAQIAMALGLRPVQPICRLCGQVLATDGEVKGCVGKHMESGAK
ncbi:MAG: hypothetical protein Q7R85_00510 [bacterium]|nr:hypothetical protein [bacterium]